MHFFDLIHLHLPVLQYMQFMEDYSEPQPSVFYQMPQSESIYEQRNKRFQEVYGFNDSFSSTDSVHEVLQPPALPPKQRQLVRKLCFVDKNNYAASRIKKCRSLKRVPVAFFYFFKFHKAPILSKTLLPL